MSENLSLNAAFEAASGHVPYNMTNDYMFRAVLQKNNYVLKGLISSLLHIPIEEIKSVEITNPIVLGNAITDKEMRLDINVILNNSHLINLEMQVANYFNWHNRSISYLCRSFDQLNKGEDYISAKPVIHIGFLDFSLEGRTPEFYSTYKLINVKNHEVYSDNLTLSVVDLNKIELATEEDKAYHIDYWASLFKADSWEGIKMLAEKDNYIKEASKTIFELTSDEMIQKRCRDREEYYLDKRAMERIMEEQKTLIEEQSTQLAEKEAEIAALKARLAELQR